MPPIPQSIARTTGGNPHNGRHSKERPTLAMGRSLRFSRPATNSQRPIANSRAPQARPPYARFTSAYCAGTSSPSQDLPMTP